MRMSIFLLILLATYAWGASTAWEGEWPSANGELELTKCKSDTCEFSLGSINGSHTCDLEGSAKITKNQVTLTSAHDSDAKSCIITGDINEGQINIKNVPKECQYYCGVSAKIDVKYTKKGISPVYNPSYDCTKAQLKTEKVICHDEILSLGDKELDGLYKERLNKNAGEKTVQKEWLTKRNTICSPLDHSCIGDLYLKRIKDLRGHTLCDDQATRSFTLLYTLRKHLGRTAFNEYNEIMNEIETSYSGDTCFSQGSSPGLRTVSEGAIVYKGEVIWIAFTHIDEKGSVMRVYGPKGKVTMPAALREWITNFSTRAKKVLKEESFQVFPDA